MSNRKDDHITLANQSRISSSEADNRFYYEPMLTSHPTKAPHPFPFLGKEMKYPILVSSMTGGADKAKNILIAILLPSVKVWLWNRIRLLSYFIR